MLFLGSGKAKQLLIYQRPRCFSACQCSGPGQYDGTCDSETGQCLCRTGFEGHSCNQCAPGYFNYPLCQRAYLSPCGPGWARTNLRKGFEGGPGGGFVGVLEDLSKGR